MKNSMLITAILVVAVGVGAFFGGVQYQKSQRGNAGSFSGQGQNRRFPGSQNGNARPVRGEIINVDDKSITVKMSDGSSKIVLLSDKTVINEATSASKQALTTGKQVVALGNDNSDGSITAQDIQLNPQMGQLNGR